MKVTFLGTSAGKPSKNRNVTSIAIELIESDYVLIDCGEATQHQLMGSTLKFSNLHSIYITHLHGDHIYGLPGLLSTLNDCREIPLNIYGPRGIKKFLSILDKSITNYSLVVHEHHNEYNTVNVIKYDHHTFNIECCRIIHTVDCFAYSINRVRTRRKIDISRLDPVLQKYKENINLLGFSPPKKIIKSLQEGTRYTFYDEDINHDFILDLKDYAIDEPDYRVIVVLDNYRCGNIFKYFKTANTLIHESTFNVFPSMSKKEKDNVYHMAIDHGHSTNQMAAHNALGIKCDNLILTHFSNRYGFATNGKMTDEKEIIDGVREAGFKGIVDIAYDFSEFILR